MSGVNRRQFLACSAAVGSAAWLAGGVAIARSRAPSEKLNIGLIGVSGRAKANLKGVQGENIVALCDVDDQKLDEAAKTYPDAKRYNDFRKMLEDGKGLDAVVVSTTEHTHAFASVMAMKLGKHVYCEKPLAHSVHEARRMSEVSREMKVATQMGTQIHAEDNYRRVVELVQSGAIGPVREAHIWCDRTTKGTRERPTETPPVPPYLHWDLWLGPAPERPYNPEYHTGGCLSWDKRWDFGNGTLGDMGSHEIDLPFWALDLRHPTSVEAEGEPRDDEAYPAWLIARWEHPARGNRPAVKVTWYDGGKRPEMPEGIKPEDWPKWSIGVIFVGDKGKLVADYRRRILSPTAKFADFQAPPESIPKSLGHHAEWINACKTGAPTLCNFDYSGALVEHNLLGCAAFRVGKKLLWDAVNLKATNCPEADRYIHTTYRQGWTLG